MKKFLLSLLSLLACSCSGTFKHSLNFNASEPLRVAVLPFVMVDDQDQTIEASGDLLIDDVDLLSTKQQGTPDMFVRNLVQSELSKTGLDVISPALVDGNLSHKGFDDLGKMPPFKLDKIRNADPKDLCTNVFSCDAVLFGKVTRWSRSYYGIESVNSVGIEIKIISAKDGKVLFTSSAEDSDSRGISKGPTGFSDLVIEPIRGLNSDIITDLARKTVDRLIAPLEVQNRPEFLLSAPPAIYASAHDAPNGTLDHNSYLTVVALGNAKNTASFSIGSIVENVPMVEKDSGHYIGKYFPLSADGFKDQPVYVSLTDQFGRTTKQKLGTSLLTLD